MTLKDVKEISNPGAPLKEQQFIAVTNIQEWSSGPADAKVPNGAGADSACIPYPSPARYQGLTAVLLSSACEL